MLVAAFAFARSSPKLHNWLVSHKVFGPLILNWQTHRAIAPRAKFLSVLTMVIVVAISVVFKVPTFVLVAQIIVLSCVAAFLLTRPTPPKAVN